MTFGKDHPMFGIKIASPLEVGMRIQMGSNFDLPKPLVIYHGNCADGFSAAWCFWNLSQKNFDFHAGVYNEPPPDVTGRIVYLVDFSYRRDVVKGICSKARHVYLIDHHKTAIDDLSWLVDEGSDEHQNNFTWYVDLERSGAMLAWDFLHNVMWIKEDDNDLATKIYTEFLPEDHRYVAPPLLLDHVQDRDLWRFKLAGTREIQAAMFSYEYTFENWDAMMLGKNPYGGEPTTATQMATLSDLKRQGEAIERKHHKDIAELVKVCERTMSIGGHLVPAASVPYTLASDAGHLMAKNNESGTEFAACYYDTATHRIFSLRSTENGMDVSEIAKLYGGGGHKNAAGFRVPRDHILARS